MSKDVPGKFREVIGGVGTGTSITIRQTGNPWRTETGYGQIIKSSALMGGSSLVAVLISLVRTKAVALLLGPSGMGLWGIYMAIADLAQSVAGLGIISSGIRQMAAAAGTGDTRIIARTALVLRRVSLILGVLGAGGLLLLSGPVAHWSFGDESNQGQVALLALAIVLRVIAEAQTALMHGLRRIADLARMGIAVAFLGAVSGVAWVYGLGVQGIVPALVTLSGITILASAWYCRKIELPRISLSFTEMRKETAALLSMGVVFMASGLMVMGTAYLIRLMIVQQLNHHAAGLYQAALALGGLYVGLVLHGLGSDFYPRLTALAHDNAACNRLVNQQGQVGFLLAGPGVLATLVLAPIVIHLFYSPAFEGAVALLRWLCLGMMLRIISWPMSFIILAKGSKVWFFWSELIWTLMYLGLTWLGLLLYGLNGIGMGLFMAHAFHGLMIYGIVRRLSGFRWSAENREIWLLGLPVIGLVFASFYVLPDGEALAFGLLAIVVSGAYVTRTLFELLPPQSIPAPMARFLTRRMPSVWVPHLAWRFGMLTLVSIWGFWYERSYGWSGGFNQFAVVWPAFGVECW